MLFVISINIFLQCRIPRAEGVRNSVTMLDDYHALLYRSKEILKHKAGRESTVCSVVWTSVPKSGKGREGEGVGKTKKGRSL